MRKKYIYFEKQTDLLCGQHALNMLIQRLEFDASHLAQCVERLDQREMELTGISSDLFQSQNASDSGFFSIQVLSEALKTHRLLLFDINKPQYVHYIFQPEDAQAFIINQSQHWFTLRRFGEMWFILNSVWKGPKFIATPLLQQYFAKLVKNRSSIYVVEGNLDLCEADFAALNGELNITDGILELKELNSIVGNNYEDKEIEKAITASLKNGNKKQNQEVGITVKDEEIRAKREKFLSRLN